MELVIYISQPTSNSGIVEYIGASSAYGGQIAILAKQRHKRNKRDCRVVRIDERLNPFDYRGWQKRAHKKLLSTACFNTKR